MLPNISLDAEKYKDILDGARNMIVSLYPEWTDFNYHDPGITLLELFAWIKESQQYYIDQIGDENRKKYLKLAGIWPQNKVPARAEVEITAEQNLLVLKGTKFYAGEICFEAEQQAYVLKNEILRCLSYEGEQARIIDRWQLDLGNKLRIYPFGREPQVDDCFYIGFDEALPQHILLGLSVEVYDEYRVKRTPIDKGSDFYALAELVVEVHTDRGWREAQLQSDETYAFLNSGCISFSIDSTMEPAIIEDLKGYYLRLRLGRAEYDIPPLLQAIRFNSLIVRQRDTHSEVIDFKWADDGRYFAATELSIIGSSQLYAEIGADYYLLPMVTKVIDYENNAALFQLDTDHPHQGADGFRLINTKNSFANSNIAGYGTGLPFQEFDLNGKDIEYDSFEIMTEDAEVLDHYFAWAKVRDFANSGPEDRHYIFEAAKGIVRFGDCIKGMAPEGQIVIIGCSCTLGSAGNVRRNTINRIGPAGIPDIKVSNRYDAGGGRDEESLSDCFKRLQRVLKKPRTAVSYQDYEDYVLKTPGLMIESCKAIPANLLRQLSTPMDMTMAIAVKPFYPERAETISAVYIRNIMKHLDSFRLIGTNIQLIAPEYIAVTVYADVSVKPHYIGAQKLVEKAVQDFFLGYKDQFGVEVFYSELYGVIDRLECVSFVASLSLEAKGSGISRTKEGNIILPANGVVLLSGLQFMFSIDNE